VWKSLWGTDTRLAQPDQHAEAHRMVAEAEVKVERLNMTLDRGPPRNLDETLYELTNARRE
jgi:hypothetical protein